ncbi:hypothetical protein FGG08_002598 [Glutinoglossum americanum]|uniref:PhoD-like phosphatase domain-containing protein n=1 Tax=Glutinoglossum americanum TaxID=1670608 RepID=A0A9P8I901_9PEZI|nr:hypothetical protein FGG08_002598 [Glutinoglossum americanum]
MERRTSSRRAAQSPLEPPADYPQGLLQPSPLEGPDPSISTVSPFESPSTPSFPVQGGLAPRPPSFTYNGGNPVPQRRPVTRGKDPAVPPNPQRRPTNRWEDHPSSNNSQERPAIRGKDLTALSNSNGHPIARGKDTGPLFDPQERLASQERDLVTLPGPQRRPSTKEKDPIFSTDPQRRPSTKGKDPVTSTDPQRRPSAKGKGSSDPHRRPSTSRGDRSIYDKPLPDPPPEAPDAPRAPPPVSYRGPRVNGGPPIAHQRNPKSFAERVQGSRSNRSALSGSYEPAQHLDRQGSVRRHKSDGKSAATMPQSPQAQTEGRRPSSSANPSSTHHRSGSRTTSSQDPTTATLPPARPETRKASVASNNSVQQPIDWAPNSSPLQKLESTLIDISREEKRADREESQILEREARGGRGGRRVSQGGTSAVPAAGAGPSSLAEAGLVRSLSSKQKERLQQSATVGSRKDRSRSRSPKPDTGRGFEYQEQQYVRDPTLVSTESGAPARNSSFRDRSAAKRTDNITSSTGGVARSSNSTSQGGRHHSRHQSLSVPHTRQHAEYHSNRAQGPLVYDATGARDDEAPKHFQSGDSARPSIVNTGAGSKNIPSAQKPGSQKAQEILGLHDERGKYRFLDAFHHGLRDGTRSGSPELPHAAPAGLTEWKQAGTASLSATEFLLDPEPAPIDKAWWEGGSTGKKRSSTGGRRNIPSASNWTDGINESENIDGMSSPTQPHEDHKIANDLHEIERRIDPVVPPARHLIGFEGTSKSNAKVQRRSKFNLQYQRVYSTRTYLTSSNIPVFPSHSFFSDSLLADYKISNALHFHKKLTHSMRSIRVREAPAPTTFRPPLFLKCGPLLRYRGMRFEPKSQKPQRNGIKEATYREIWTGSVMIVTADDNSSYETPPILRLFYQPVDLVPPPPTQLDGDSGELAPEYVDPIAGLPKVSRTGETLYVKPVEQLPEEKDLSALEDENGLYTGRKNVADLDGLGDSKAPLAGKRKLLDGERVGRYKEVKGIRLLAELGVTFWRFNIEVELAEKQSRIAYRINRGPAIGFWVPGTGQTMNIMFHSCNGFSVGVTNRDQFSGPDPLWRDVLNTHQTKPFHVMIGGGDQIYNDSVMRQTAEFQEWLEIKNPLHKHSAAFTVGMRKELETFYLERYSMWFSQGLFGLVNSQIPMVNIWDDHDIIDGYGSYPHHFMSSPVFSGLGAVAFKYYMLFQHQSVVDEGEEHEPSWTLGAAPGPYINELSRSVFMFLGRKVAFVGLTSRLLDPVKALGRAGLFSGFINKFDGGVEILDDLDDHWTAKNHKDERNWLIQELQQLAADKSVRVTILGGDVHLAAVGRFYSNPNLGIPKDCDHRYMPNIISSAIVNGPPTEIMSDILNKRNKVHHLDEDTDEDMIPIFTHDVDNKPRNNKRLLPRRNWCSISPYEPGNTPPPTPEQDTRQEALPQMGIKLARTLSLSRENPLPNIFRRNSRRGQHKDGEGANNHRTTESADAIPIRPSTGSGGYFPRQHPTSPSADTPAVVQGTDRPNGGLKRTLTKARGAVKGATISLDDGLDVILNCEVSQKDPAGITSPYRLLVPALYYQGEGDINDSNFKGRRWSSWGRWRT